MIQFTAGATSQSIDIFIPSSASTTGAGLTGLAYNSSGLVAYYRIGTTGSPTQITLATLANAQAAWSSGGFVEVDATNMPGVYRLDIPNAALASAALVHVMLKGATNMAPTPVRIDCRPYQADVQKFGGTTVTGRDLGASVLLSSGTGTGQVSLSSGKVAATLASTDVTGNVAADLQTIKTQTVTCAGGVTFPAATLASTANITTVGAVSGAVGSVTGNVGGNVVGSVASVTAGVTVTTNNDKTGYSLASTGLDAISTTAPTGVASNFREMMVQVWRRFFKKATKTSTQIKTYADDGNTVVTTQPVSDDNVTQTQGAAT